MQILFAIKVDTTVLLRVVCKRNICTKKVKSAIMLYFVGVSGLILSESNETCVMSKLFSF